MTRTLPRLLRKRLVRPAFAVALLALLAPLPAVQAQDASRVTIVTHADQPLATAIDAGPMPSSQLLSLTLTLKSPAAPSATLEPLLQSQIAYSSPRLRSWLSPEQFADQSGASTGQLATVATWAVAQGLSINAVSSSGLRLSVSGSASQIERAFALTLHLYQAHGQLFFANVTQPSLPVDVAAAVLAIDGLDNLSSNAPAGASPIRSATASPVAAGVTLTSNVSATLSGYSVTLTASVTGATASAVTPTGNVSFYVAGTTPRLLGVSAVGMAGAGLSISVLATPNIPTGAQTIYAVYAGDTNFSSAISNNLSIGVSDYNVTFVPQSLTVARGQSGQMTLVLGLINSFPGTVAFGCTPPPNTEITCAFSPTTLTGGGTSTMILQTSAPKTSALRYPSAPGFRSVGGVLLASLLGCLLPSRRRRLPSMLLVLLAFALTMNLGCATNNFVQTGAVTDAGTPLGTASMVVNTAGTDGLNTIRHNYTFQVTVQ